MRTVALLSGLRLVATPIPPGSELVRVHPDDGPLYDRMTVVTLEPDGALHVSGWIGEPLSVSDWQEARATFYPEATGVRWERLRSGMLMPRAVK